MAKWYDGAEQAAFKQTTGGYVFELPTFKSYFVRQPGYLVNEAQKARLAELLRRQRRQVLGLLMLYIFAGITLIAGLAAAGAVRMLSPMEFIGVVALCTLGVVPIVLVPQLVLLRAARPLLAGQSRTDERITMSDRLRAIAVSVSPKIFWIGIAGGAGMIIGNGMNLADALVAGRTGTRLLGPMFSLGCGALLTGYFVYLLILKRRLRPN
jgi:hypothetical protein